MRKFIARRPTWMRFFFNPIQRLVGVFLIFILLPGTFLSIFAFRVLRQEEQLITQRTKENLERTAKEIGRELGSVFTNWDRSVGLAAESGILSPDFLPDIIGQALNTPGGGVLLFRVDGDLSFFPSFALLFLLDSPTALPTPTSRLPAGFSEAESLEIKQKDYIKAIAAYRNLLKSSKTEIRTLLLQRLARTLRKAGRLDEAADTYSELLVMDTVWFGGLPSDLVGHFELCALADVRGDMSELGSLSLSFYRDLVGGKWLLEEPRYISYSVRCRSWCRESQVQPDEFTKLQMVEESKLALTRAAKEFSIEPKRIQGGKNGRHFCFWQNDPFAAVLLSENHLSLLWWPQFISSQSEDLESTLYSTDGHVLFGSVPVVAPPLAVMQSLNIDSMPWRIQIWPKNPDVIQREVKQRQNLFLAIFLFIGILLIFGSYITVRIVRRELEISRMRADFVSTVSHEFRSPLTGIRHLGEMLLDGRAMDVMKQKQYFKMIVQESDRLTRLVENILDFSRMEEGRKEYRFEPLDTSPWLMELVADFEKEITTQGVVIDASVPDGLPAILADNEALGSAVHNLLDNAIKYSPRKKFVRVEAKAIGREVNIVIHDQGVGISEIDQKHIFDRFYRVDSEITKQIKGAGLGLNLVRHIVTAHNGKIECESRVGEGSTFSIRIPALTISEGGSHE
ncbi:ATP-binding protein [Acidobacteriota bacterium]